MKVRSEYKTLRSHALQLEGIISAINCCIDDPARRNLCIDMIEVANELATKVSSGVDRIGLNIQPVGA